MRRLRGKEEGCMGAPCASSDSMCVHGVVTLSVWWPETMA